MAEQLILHYFPPSPNNIKVAIGLSYKELPHEVRLIHREDRSGLVEISGQPLSPVLEDGGRAVFDSSAILRYLDANFDGPRLFAEDRDSLKEIEAWELHSKAVIGPPLGKAFGVLFSGGEDDARVREAAAEMTEASAELEKRLEGRDWLVGDSMTAADIFNACFLGFSCFPENVAHSNKIWPWFYERFRLGEGRPRCREWVSRVFAHLP
ncbi:MAG TPA: glutathione S-transferase family protein [Planctomycetes bacterium]|nr:glutathione S-transferase family protein [Planctomycetota bacterium]